MKSSMKSSTSGMREHVEIGSLGPYAVTATQEPGGGNERLSPWNLSFWCRHGSVSETPMADNSGDVQDEESRWAVLSKRASDRWMKENPF